MWLIPFTQLLALLVALLTTVVCTKKAKTKAPMGKKEAEKPPVRVSDDMVETVYENVQVESCESERRSIFGEPEKKAQKTSQAESRVSLATTDSELKSNRMEEKTKSDVEKAKNSSGEKRESLSSSTKEKKTAAPTALGDRPTSEYMI